ncbi:MAG: ubiquitin family protein [Thermoplasmataceae archaeon]|jgi:sulfur carrier protein ThiS
MIKIIGRKSDQATIKEPLALLNIMQSMSISRERFIALLNGAPATSDDIVKPDDDLVFLEIFSGG